MRLKKEKKTKFKRIEVRASEQEKNDIQLKANLYTDGNISEWIIYASMNYKPKKSELV